MAYLLYFIILIVFCFLLSRLSFFKKSEIAARWLIGLFLVRAVMGLVNCYLSYHYFEISDPRAFHIMGLNEYYQLTTNPGYFIAETFKDYGNHYSGLLATSDSFWNNLKTNVIVKTLAVLNIFTFRNFYINTLIFNTVVFTGSVALYRTLQANLSGNKTLLIITVFLFPSGLYYTSQIHRDGLIWLSLAFLLFAGNRLLKKGFTWKRLAIVLGGIMLIFALRNYLAFIILPALAAWWLSHRQPAYTLTINLMVFFIGVILFFFLRNIIPAADFPQFIVNRFQAFDEISEVSRTYLPMPALNASFYSFMQSFPFAACHAFLLPLFWQMHTMLELPFAIEIFVAELLFVFWIIRQKRRPHPLVLFILFVSLISMIMIGYTVPNLGAILRYRSVYLQLIVILLASGVFQARDRNLSHIDTH